MQVVDPSLEGHREVHEVGLAAAEQDELCLPHPPEGEVAAERKEQRDGGGGRRADRDPLGHGRVKKAL